MAQLSNIWFFPCFFLYYSKYTYVEYARFSDDMVILVDAGQRNNWLMKAVEKRLREEFTKLQSLLQNPISSGAQVAANRIKLDFNPNKFEY